MYHDVGCILAFIQYRGVCSMGAGQGHLSGDSDALMAKPVNKPYVSGSEIVGVISVGTDVGILNFEIVGLQC